jgi:3-phosphoshikimate 1-carboxyvinyltransferase
MNYRISHPTKKVRGDIQLPASKSISNRALIIQALCSEPFEIHNLSEAKDTQVLQQILNDSSKEINVGDAGTTMRFLTGFLALQKGEHILTGSRRMRERPIRILVETLKTLGANISYLQKEGFPPLQIKGHKLLGGTLEVNSSISSQYISTLLLIAPTLEKGLTIHLKRTLVSKPYIEMTLSIMAYFGVESEWKGNCITIKQQVYQAKNITIESDWSAAAFWLEIVSLSRESNITLKGLHKNSWQGDQKVLSLFEGLGVKGNLTDNGLSIRKSGVINVLRQYNLLDTPDLAQPLISALAGTEKETLITGLQTLQIKETDRLKALKKELKKLGVKATINKQALKLRSINLQTPKEILATYNDHRMAMCLAPLALQTEGIIIQDIDVVEKSYPTFWEDLKKVGFKITSVTGSSR